MILTATGGTLPFYVWGPLWFGVPAVLGVFVLGLYVLSEIIRGHNDDEDT